MLFFQFFEKIEEIKSLMYIKMSVIILNIHENG